jgi:hypothetical protein
MSDTKEELRKEILATIESLNVHRRKYGRDARYVSELVVACEEHLDHLVEQWNALLAKEKK